MCRAANFQLWPAYAYWIMAMGRLLRLGAHQCARAAEGHACPQPLNCASRVGTGTRGRPDNAARIHPRSGSSPACRRGGRPVITTAEFKSRGELKLCFVRSAGLSRAPIAPVRDGRARVGRCRDRTPAVSSSEIARRCFVTCPDSISGSASVASNK